MGMRYRPPPRQPGAHRERESVTRWFLLESGKAEPTHLIVNRYREKAPPVILPPPVTAHSPAGYLVSRERHTGDSGNVAGDHRGLARRAGRRAPPVLSTGRGVRSAGLRRPPGGKRSLCRELPGIPERRHCPRVFGE